MGEDNTGKDLLVIFLSEEGGETEVKNDMTATDKKPYKKNYSILMFLHVLETPPHQPNFQQGIFFTINPKWDI